MKNSFNILFNKLILETSENLKNTQNNILQNIKDILNDETLQYDESILNKIYGMLKYLKYGSTTFTDLNNLLITDIKLSEKQAKNICIEISEILETETVLQLINFLKHNRLDINNYLGKLIPFGTLMSETQLPQPEILFNYFYNKQFNSIPNVGKGELLCAIIFNQGLKPHNSSGDVLIRR
jgi:hypothetical protein